MGRTTTALGAILLLLAGGAGGAALAANEGGILKRIFSGIEPKERVSTGAGAAAIIQEVEVGFADIGAKELRKSTLAPAIKAELRHRPGDIYVVEVMVPASAENTEQPIDPRTITAMGPGANLWDALARANTIRSGTRPSALDYKRSRFLIATLVDGELYWREVLVPSPEVLRERVAAALAVSASGTASAVPASNQPVVSRASISSTTNVDPPDRSDRIDYPTPPSLIDAGRASTPPSSNSAPEATLQAGQSIFTQSEAIPEERPSQPPVSNQSELTNTTSGHQDPGPHSPESSGGSSSGSHGSEGGSGGELPASTYVDNTAA